MRNLTSAELTFQSFQHSQGGMGPQLLMFRYIELCCGIEPDLHPMGADFGRYARYVEGTGTGKKNHINVCNPQERTGHTITETMKAIRRNRVDSYGRSVSRSSREATVNRLAANLINRETTILDPYKPWVSYRTKEEEDRPDRIRARVESGRSSFLYYYGRDGNKTGFPEIDKMYSDVWEQAEQPEFGRMRTEHARAVVDAELNFLGRTVLGRIEDLVP